MALPIASARYCRGVFAEIRLVTFSRRPIPVVGELEVCIDRQSLQASLHSIRSSNRMLRYSQLVVSSLLARHRAKHALPQTGPGPKIVELGGGPRAFANYVKVRSPIPLLGTERVQINEEGLQQRDYANHHHHTWFSYGHW